ncbi:UPF0104 family protein [Corallococcus sp. H22C18031201]|uniref:lysylphosphatidylglycerol synthase domain-containing protein n=1 Tax=Citreicoccus inhibens TaxID=2849499 RepID=UPI000E7097C4|nr:lysylphosphatidylglycerol synthase domain-containing protein [Citreicoccus inhibens]MBU8898889.1 flippase-like domain-containing protein [Citreicoccus inhibens]RJS24075.1 UPF0104 family protein [Corallococcus sp. H22C18031201]
MRDARQDAAVVGPAIGEAEPGRALFGGSWRLRLIVGIRILFALLGLGMLAMLVHRAGPSELGLALKEAAPWLPWVALIEVGRQALDASATWLAHGPRARLIPVSVLARAQLIGTAVSSMAPAGRAAAEATKAALVTPYTGGAAASSAAATAQAASLGAGGLISFPCAYASFLMTGNSAFTIAMLIHGTVLLLTSLGVRACMRARKLGAWLRRRRKRWASQTEVFQDSACSGPLLPWRPMLAFMCSRSLQVMQYAVLAHAVGINASAVQALFAQGLYLVALALGSLVPGQVGVTDGAFSLAAGALGTTTARAMSIALLAHTVQAGFVLAGALTPLVWRPRRPSPPRSSPAPACR